MNKFLLSVIILSVLFSVKLSAQAPNISYTSPQTFYLGENITPVTVKNTGGTVPARLAPQFVTTQLADYYSFQGFVRVPSGDLYAIQNQIVYRIKATGVVSVLAGTGQRGYADGTGAAASFQDMGGIAADAAGNLFVTDNNYRDVTNSRIRKITPAGVVTTYAAGLSGLGAITVDAHGIIYFSSGARIMKITTDGVVSLLAGKNANGKDNGTGANASFGYNLPSMVTDKAGNVYVTDSGYNMIRKITPDGVTTTIAGSGAWGSQDGAGAVASFVTPSFINIDSKGNLLVADGYPSIRTISPDGMVTTTILKDSYGDNGQIVYYNFPNQFALNSNDDLISVGGSQLNKILMTGYNIAPLLPAGVVLNPDGSISGTPISQSALSTYRIIASNSAGTSSANISLETAVPKKAPVLTSFSPTSAPSYGHITINGNYFTGTTKVTVGGRASFDFTVVSPTQLSVQLADSAASGNIVVTNPFGSAYIPGFKYIPPPVITSFSPVSGGNGSIITIRGTNFTPTAQVIIGGVYSQSVTFVSSTTIKATVSPYTYGSGDISVSSENGYGHISGFTFIGQPAISSASPYYAATGATITIAGSNFNNATGVKFGNINATSFKVVSPTTITAVVPADAGSSITITTPYGTATSYSLFSYVGPPKITGVTPMKGGLNSAISISGINLDNAKVSIGGVAAPIAYSSSYYLDATVGNKGSNDYIKIVTPGGTTVFTGFTWIPAPLIKSFKPQTAGSGDKITITGTNLSEVDNVSIGGVYAAFKVLSSTSIEATVGPGASGSLIVTSEGGTATATGFTYTGPDITSFTPVNAGAGQTVTITGNKFTNATAVDFGGVPAVSFIVNSATQITAVVGAGRSGNVTVTTPLGKGTHAGFTHPGPLISYFTPNYSGPVSQPPIYIYGGNFTGATAVSFGGVPAAAFTVYSDNTIAATPATSKSGDVMVTTPLGTDKQPGFTWATPPAITSFTPATQKNGGQVTITGTNFTGLTSVKFGGVSAQYFYLTSPTTIIAGVGLGASGSVAISTVGGTAAKAGFIYTSPLITSISPTIAAAGKTVTINGGNLDSVKSVKFGSTDAKSFTIVSSKKITAVVGSGTSGEVTVTGSTGTSTIYGFTFLPPPVIYSISAGSGGTGTIVSIYGYNLTTTSAVKIGNVAATIISVTNNEVKVKVGPGNTGNFALTTTAGTVGFSRFTWYASPVITSATPMTANSETLVTITGQNFTGVTEVKFGGEYGGFDIVSPTQINVLPSYVKSGDITVTGPGGTATLPGFTFLPAPLITSFTTTGDGANSTVTITGTNFNGVTNVQFGGINAKTYTVLSPTSISATPGSGATGPITVTANGGKATISGFLYIKPPSVLSFSPASGPIGTQLTITGDNFNLTPEKNVVFFGPVQAQVINATKTQLTVTVPAHATGLISVINTDNKLSGSSNLPFLVTTKIGFSGFANKTEIKLGTQSQVYAVDDLDGDGKPDILIASQDTLYMLKNTSGPAMTQSSFSQKIIIETGKTVLSMVVGDVDGDGKKDILISIPNCVAVLHNNSVNGNMSFQLKVMEYMNNGTGMLLRDLNGDGRPDLIVGTEGFNPAPVAYPNTSTASDLSFGTSMPIYNPYSGGTISFALTDIDGDNKPDPILGGSYSDVTIFKNNAVPGDLNTGEFPSADAIISQYNYIPWSIATGDLDGDGKADIIDNTQNNQLFVLRNTTTTGVINTSSFADAKAFNSTSLLYNMAAADINGDGRIDVVGSSNTAMYYARNLSTKGNISLTAPASIIPNYLNNITFCDMDGDGRIDVLGVDQNNKLIIYNNSPKQLPQITQVSQLSAAAGTAITITGKNFDGTTIVKFGASAAKSFTVTSPQTIQAVVGTGSTGTIILQTPDGTATYPGFIFLPAPVITSAAMLSNKTAMVITGQNFVNVSDVSINSTPSTSFTVNSATNITAVFPNISGTLSVTNLGGVATKANVTYSGVNNAVLSGSPDHANQQLSVYAVVDRNTHAVNLTLTGGAPYHMLLNGISYNTNDSLITLPLNRGTSKLTVSTDKISQGKVEQTLNLLEVLTPYPNPFRDVLNINLGNDVIKQATIKIFNLSTGLLKLTKQVSNQSGVISIDVSSLEMGVYTVHLIIGSKESIYKVYK